MFRFDPGLKVFLHRDAVDGRKHINGLAALVEQALGLDPLSRTVFAFSNRRRDRVRLLLWERNGFWLLTKRLEQDRFKWPGTEAVLELTTEQLHWLLEGIDVEAVRRHPPRPCSPGSCRRLPCSRSAPAYWASRWRRRPSQATATSG